jgi:hypothetical protein
MATTYKATIEVRCWKEHSCVSCGGTFAYLFVRRVTGQAGTEAAAMNNAQAAARKAVKHEVDLRPCPTCGLYQPDMVGAQRARRHWMIFWATLGYLTLLLVLQGFAVLTADATIWLLALGCALALVANLVVDWHNPNRDLEANQQLARRDLETGRMQQGQAGRTESPSAELGTPRWSPMHRLAFVLMVVALGVLVLPEGIRAMRGWPLNGDWHPPVAGPGDETYLYLPDSISSVKGFWSGAASVSASLADSPNEPAFQVAAVTNNTNWGNNIRVKSSEKYSSSRLWVTLRLPDRPDLAGKKLQFTIDLKVNYPMMMGANFVNQQGAFNRTGELRLATPGAGKEYNQLWWLGVLGGGGLLLAMNLGLIGAANALKRQALPTNVYTVQEDQPQADEPAPPEE